MFGQLGCQTKPALLVP